MNLKIKSSVAAIYNNVWRDKTARLKGQIRAKCDAMPHKRRMRVVAVAFTVFLLTAFFVFGHACYKIGKGQSRDIEPSHIHNLELPASDNPDALKLPPYEDIG